MSHTILIVALTLLSITVTTLIFPLAVPLAVECPQLALASLGSVIPLAFMIPNSVTAVTTVRSGLQRTAITELFKIGRTPLANLFLTGVMTSVSSEPSQDGCVDDKSTLTVQSF